LFAAAAEGKMVWPAGTPGRAEIEDSKFTRFKRREQTGGKDML